MRPANVAAVAMLLLTGLVLFSGRRDQWSEAGIKGAPFGWLDAPAAGPVHGTITVRGWALDGDGAVRKIEILLDGKPLAISLTAQTRDDVCTKYPRCAGCPNAGFTGQLDVSRLSRGPHQISLRFTDDGGNTTEVGARGIVVR